MHKIWTKENNVFNLNSLDTDRYIMCQFTNRRLNASTLLFASWRVGVMQN